MLFQKKGGDGEIAMIYEYSKYKSNRCPLLLGLSEGSFVHFSFQDVSSITQSCSPDEEYIIE